MEKLGYILLISVYLLVFPIAGGLSDNIDESIIDSLSSKNFVESISHSLSGGAIFDSLRSSMKK